MDVRLLTVTPNALDVLLFTKQTRLRMTADGLAEVAGWSEERKADELRYMRNTIQSSWEFVDYTFAITGVTRAFTHQLVRHRVGTSFAQQAQRVVNMEGFHYLASGAELHPDGRLDTTAAWPEHGAVSSERNAAVRDGWAHAGKNPSNVYDRTMQQVDAGYNELLDLGVKPQDARGVLPTNICTSIVFKANLRTLHDMALKRLCVKAQGEFQDVFRLLVERVIEVHPWADAFLRVQCAWNGTCLFPSLPVTDCHVKPWVYDPEHAVSYGQSSGLHSKHEAYCLPTAEIYQLHRSKRTEIQPTVAKPQKLGCGSCGKYAIGYIGDFCKNADEHGPCGGNLQAPDAQLVEAFAADLRAGGVAFDELRAKLRPLSALALDRAKELVDAEAPDPMGLARSLG